MPWPFRAGALFAFAALEFVEKKEELSQTADHLGASGVAPEEFEKKVVGWFEQHQGGR